MTVQRTPDGALTPGPRRSALADLLDGAGRVSIVRESFGFVAGVAAWVTTFVAASGLSAVALPYQIAASLVAAGAAMWLANQVVTFLRRNREGFSWGLAYEALVLAYNPSDANAGLQLGVAFRNVTMRPIQYYVERFDVVVANRTLTKPTFTNSGGVIPRATQRFFRAPAFPSADVAEFVGKPTQGTIEFVVAYGAPGQQATRQLTMRLDVTLNMTAERADAAELIAAEADEPI